MRGEQLRAGERFRDSGRFRPAIGLATRDSHRGYSGFVRQQLQLDDGRMVRIVGEPAQGTRHQVLFGVLPEQEEPVVVKVERIPGALARECAALDWLGEVSPGSAPRLIDFTDAILAGERVTCLVMDRHSGRVPDTVAGWKRMGAAVARLAEVGYPRHVLPVKQTDAFVQAHVDRIGELGARLDPFVHAIKDWTELTHRSLPRSSVLVLTHGDPGPGNYLHTDSTGVLIDWEEAQVAPLGLDLGRLMFIALLGSGPSGFVARDQQERMRAVAEGYLNTVRDVWTPEPEELRWWLSVAAIQFVHRRWQLDGRPAPWEHVAHVLTSALNEQIA